MEQRRIKIEGWPDSDVNLKIAVIQSKTGAVHLAIEGVEPTMQNLVQIRMLLDEVCKKIDTLLPKLLNDSVKEINRG